MSNNLNELSNENRYILNKLERYMITNHFLDAFVKENNYHDCNNKYNVKINKKIIKDNIESKETQKENEDYIQLNEKDNRFWYFYMFINDLEINDLPPKQERFKTQTEEKINYVEKFNKNKELKLKEYKLVKKNIISSLSDVKNLITLEDLIALCILYKRNIIYAHNNMYYEGLFGLTSGNNEYDIIIKDEKGVEKIPNNSRKNDIYKEIKSKYYQVENISKKLKSISSYKLNELQELAKKLHITQIENKLKKEIYDDILNKLNNF
jgi:hypothetical protein